jgi:hypothetical protein
MWFQTPKTSNSQDNNQHHVLEPLRQLESKVEEQSLCIEKLTIAMDKLVIDSGCKTVTGFKTTKDNNTIAIKKEKPNCSVALSTINKQVSLTTGSINKECFCKCDKVIITWYREGSIWNRFKHKNQLIGKAKMV